MLYQKFPTRDFNTMEHKVQPLTEPKRVINNIDHVYACTLVIRATESRIIGRNVPSHWSMVQEITNKYGFCQDSIDVLLKDQCTKRHLNYEEVDFNEAKNALSANRAVIGMFYLDDVQWDTFTQFVTKNANGILSEKYIGSPHLANRIRAVCIVGYSLSCWKIQKSWGCKPFQDDYCYIKFDSIKDMKYYDVYYRVCDLTTQDWINFEIINKAKQKKNGQ